MVNVDVDKNSAVNKLLKNRLVIVVSNACVDETGARKHKLAFEHEKASPVKRLCGL